ncbi:MAG: hypothetical protein ABSB56_04805 [Nitrososphaerales archaeon]|jgi:hypothetical protein
MSKRYVLLVADGDLSDGDRRDLSAMLERRHGKVTVILVEGNPRAVIVKTTNTVAPLLREMSGELHLGEKRLVTVLTSGSIGKLKSRASGGGTTKDGEIP